MSLIGRWDYRQGVYSSDATNFSGSGQYYSKAAPTLPSSIHIVTIIAPDSVTGNNVVSGQWDGGTDRAYKVWFRPGSNGFGWSVSDDGANENLRNIAAAQFTANAYCMVECWHDAVNDIVACARDGATAGADFDSAAHTTGMNASALNLEIGAFNSGSNPYAGEIQYFVILDVATAGALNSTDRTWLYNSGSYRSLSDILSRTWSTSGASVFLAHGGGPSHFPTDYGSDASDLSATGTPTLALGDTNVLNLVSEDGPCQMNGALVRRHADQSGNSNHANETTLANMLTYDGSASPAIYSAASTELLTATFTSITGGSQIIAHGKMGASGILYAGDDGTNDWMLRESTTTAEWETDGGTSVKYGTSDTSMHVFTNTYDTASDAHRVDGIALSSSDNGAQTCDGLVFCNDNGGSSGVAGTGYSHILLYDDIATGSTLITREELAQYGDAGEQLDPELSFREIWIYAPGYASGAEIVARITEIEAT